MITNKTLTYELSSVYDALDIAVRRMSIRNNTVEEKDLTTLLKTFKTKLETEQKVNVDWRPEYDATLEVK